MYTLITGATGGLGGAFAQLLAERGEKLCLTGRSADKLAALSAKLREGGAEVFFAPCDLADERSRADFFEETDRAGLRFSRLVYVAGVDTQMAFERYDEARILMQTRVNFEAAVSFCRAVLDRAELDGTCELLSVGSVSGISPMPYFALYSATKKALEQFFAALRTELKGRAKVTCVLPGGIPTREDVKENIRAHGFFGKISAKTPRAVAIAALKAVKKNKRRLVVGFWNRFIQFFSALAPFPLRMRIIAKMWSKTEKDHFAPEENRP